MYSPSAGTAAGAVVAGPSGAAFIARSLIADGVWRPDGEGAVHRVCPTVFPLSDQTLSFLNDLGPAIWAFYKALNHLWLGKGHEWAKAWLDQGKPSWLLDLARMNYSRGFLPRILRPDLILAEDGCWVTELDSVPGGAGLTGAMAVSYAEAGESVVGGANGICEGFGGAVGDLAGREDWTLAIVVSDESEDYRSEMTWLASAVSGAKRRAWCVHPRDLVFDEQGLWLDVDGHRQRIDVVWRFFELFDLRNIPKHELVIYSGKRRTVVVSPPYKPFLEEKLALALVHHPALQDYWESEMGSRFSLFRRVVPKTWVLDPKPVPAHAEVSGLRFRGTPVRDFADLGQATQKERRLVIKPSGFSPMAWGARGVLVGHDVSQEMWQQALHDALASFPQTPHILQEFHEGKRVPVDYYDPEAGSSGSMSGRVRLSPYYFVSGDSPRLSGVLATVCPDDKKLIHGMRDAVMTVCGMGGASGV